MKDDRTNQEQLERKEGNLVKKREREEQTLGKEEKFSSKELEINPKIQLSFEEILQQNKNRIHYQMQRLNIIDPHQEFYSEGLFAMWQAYKKYEPDKGPLATYFNYMIRNRLIDTIRKTTRDQEKDEFFMEQKKEQIGKGPALLEQAKIGEPITNLEKDEYWKEIRQHLTDNQWNWVYYYIIQGMPLKEIAVLKGVSLEAVKGWGKSARGKLRKVWEERMLE